MKHFNEKEDFFLTELPDEIFGMDKEIFSIGRELKKRLGDEGYLLENYLAAILEGINDNTIQNASDAGENAFSEVYTICNKICNGTDDESIQRKKLYPEIKKYMDLYLPKHKSSYTAVAMACVSTAPLIMQQFYNQMKLEYFVRTDIDTVKLEELYLQMSKYTGELLIEQLTSLVKERFLVAPTLNACVQSATEHYLYILLQRDPVTSKQIFQLILDETSEDKEVLSE